LTDSSRIAWHQFNRDNSSIKNTVIAQDLMLTQKAIILLKMQ
jgi:hypothetical protein